MRKSLNFGFIFEFYTAFQQFWKQVGRENLAVALKMSPHCLSHEMKPESISLPCGVFNLRGEG